MFFETNSLGGPFAFVTPFSHPSFCALAIPVSFLCRSLYPNPNHAHPPQKLFSTSPSFFYYEFLLTPPPQTLSFHFPYFSVTKQKFCFLKQSHSPDHLLSSPPSSIRLLVVLLSPMSFLLPLVALKPYSSSLFPTNTLFPPPPFFYKN